MTWVRIDDSAPTHHKHLSAGPEGVCLWVAGLCYANRHNTDGLIPDVALGSLYPWEGWSVRKVRRIAERLCEVGLWHREAAGYRIHDYDQYQEEALRSVVEERRAYERERKRKQRKARNRSSSSNDPGEVGQLSRRDSPGHEEGTGQGQSTGHVHGQDEGHASDVSQPPGPARPVPSPSLSGARDKGQLAEQIWAELDEARERLKREGVSPRAKQLPVAGMGEGYRRLLDRVREIDDLEQAAQTCRHVLRVREAEARQRGNLDFLGTSTWQETAFWKAAEMEVPGDDRDAMGFKPDPLAEAGS